MLEQLRKDELDRLIAFLKMSGRLKGVPRSGWVKIGVDFPESIADHTFRTAILCMIFSDLENLDGLKMMQMALLHDLPEAIVGDLTPSERIEGSMEREDEAMKQLLNLLPKGLRERYLSLWLEYAECETKEAEAVRELEKLEMALQAREYQGAQPSLGEFERFVESAHKTIASPKIRKLFFRIFDSSS